MATPAAGSNDARTSSISMYMSATCLMVATGVPRAASNLAMNNVQYAASSLMLGFGLPEYRDHETCAADGRGGCCDHLQHLQYNGVQAGVRTTQCTAALPQPSSKVSMAAALAATNAAASSTATHHLPRAMLMAAHNSVAAR